MTHWGADYESTDPRVRAEEAAGKAALSPDLDVCPQCDSTGSFWDDQTGQPDEPYGGRMIACYACKGEGMVDTSPCIVCGAPSYNHDEGCIAAEEVQT